MKHILESIIETPAQLVPVAEALGFPGRSVDLLNETEGIGRSHKDRPVAAIILRALERGRRFDELICYTTGSSGCSVAALAKEIGLKVSLFIPEAITPERIEFMKSMGANVIETPKENWVTGAADEARSYSESRENSFLLDQSSNPDNPAAFHPLAASVLASFPFETPPTHLVSAVGTGATLVGLSEVMQVRGVRMVGVEPFQSASTWAALQNRNFQHDAHILFGTGAGKVSPILERALSSVDEVIRVNDEEAYDMCRELQKWDLDFGPTTGANVIATCQILQADSEARVVFVAHDKGERYRSRGL